MTLASMAMDLILSCRVECLTARLGDRCLGPLLHLFYAHRRMARAERPCEGIHSAEGPEDQTFTLDGLAKNHAGAKAECPHRLGCERGLKRRAKSLSAPRFAGIQAIFFG